MDPAVIAVFGAFAIPIVAIVTHHRRKMLEMQLNLRQQADANTQAAIESLRQEVRQLRDTTMEYDLSFDAALQRMEQRVDLLERRSSVSTDTGNVVEQRLGR